jgi:hypothetical protein
MKWLQTLNSRFQTLRIRDHLKHVEINLYFPVRGGRLLLAIARPHFPSQRSLQRFMATSFIPNPLVSR